MALFRLFSLRVLPQSVPNARLYSSFNIFKDPSQVIEEKPDSEYPDWLWSITQPEATREELLRDVSRLYRRGGYDAVFDGIPEKDLKRLFRLENRQRIKESNARRRGGRIV